MCNSLTQEGARSLEPDETEAYKVLSGRRGNVLGAFTILKPDHFPGCQLKTLEPRLNGTISL